LSKFAALDAILLRTARPENVVAMSSFDTTRSSDTEPSDNNNQESAIQRKQQSEWIHSFPAMRGSNSAFLANRERSHQMNKSTSLFGAAIASVVAGLCIATSSNAQSTTSEAAYCQSLVKAYSMGGNARGSLPVGNETAVAIAQCQEGNPEPAIPVLEQKLRDADITVPARS
jgi:hypothetical protein